MLKGLFLEKCDKRIIIHNAFYSSKIRLTVQQRNWDIKESKINENRKFLHEISQVIVRSHIEEWIDCTGKTKQTEIKVIQQHKSDASVWLASDFICFAF
jgi:hypothetical protein